MRREYSISLSADLQKYHKLNLHAQITVQTAWNLACVLARNLACVLARRYFSFVYLSITWIEDFRWTCAIHPDQAPKIFNIIETVLFYESTGNLQLQSCKTGSLSPNIPDLCGYLSEELDFIQGFCLDFQYRQYIHCMFYMEIERKTDSNNWNNSDLHVNIFLTLKIFWETFNI